MNLQCQKTWLFFDIFSIMFFVLGSLLCFYRCADGDANTDQQGYAYLNASGWKGTYSISASAYNYSPSQSGKWWSGVLNPTQTVDYASNLDNSYAIDYFSTASGKDAVNGIRHQSDPTNTFESEADAHNFSYNSSVTWRCERSGSSNTDQGSLCRVCN